MVDKESILASIKKLLNVDPEDQSFDTDIVVLINGEFMTLQQLGIGPDEGFAISDYSTCWTDFFDDKKLIDAVKTYVYMRVRMVFDPPASSVVADAINNKIAELTWRLNVWAEQVGSSSEKKKHCGRNGLNVDADEETLVFNRS